MVGMAIIWLGSGILLLFPLHSEQGSRTAKCEVAVSIALRPLVHDTEHCCGDGHLQVIELFKRSCNFVTSVDNWLKEPRSLGLLWHPRGLTGTQPCSGRQS